MQGQQGRRQVERLQASKLLLRGSGMGRYLYVMSEIGVLETLRQIGLTGSCLQHDMSLHQRVNAIGGRERFFQQLLDQQHGGALRATG